MDRGYLRGGEISDVHQRQKPDERFFAFVAISYDLYSQFREDGGMECQSGEVVGRCERIAADGLDIADNRNPLFVVSS